MRLVHDTAMEPDRTKQGEMMVALDRLLVAVNVLVIHLIIYETCLANYHTWEEMGVCSLHTPGQSQRPSESHL